MDFRRCDDTTDLGYEEFECDGYMEIIYVDLETYEISCGLVSTIKDFP